MIDKKMFMEFMTALEDAGAEHVSFDDLRKFVDDFPQIGDWIPCSERLPEENQSVIACFAHGTVTELRFYDKKFHGIYDYDEKVIVAWQPLPEPYHG